MSHRVTLASYYNSTLRYLAWREGEIYRYNQQVSSGQRISNPSDDAVGSVTSQYALRGLDEVNQYYSNLDSARDWVEQSESSISAMSDILSQLKEKAEQMSTGTYSASEREAMAVEVQNLLESLVALANSKLSGEYIFSGTDTDTSAASLLCTAQNPASLFDAGSEGHDVKAGIVSTSGGVSLSLTRLSQSSSAIVATSTSNTLGNNLVPPLNFDAWTSQASGGSALSSVVSLQSVASAASSVSNRVGETLTWVGSAAAGTQTYRTYATLDITGACTISIDGDVYAAASAAPDGAEEMVNSINANVATEDYYAVLDDSGLVRIVAKDTAGAIQILDLGGSGVTIDQDTSLQELVDDINQGLQATGVISLDTAGLPDPTNNTHTVTLGDYSWTWGDIVGTSGTVPTTARAYADALATHINSTTTEYTAEVVADGATATVQITAVASGVAGNVALSVNGGTSASSGGLYGGLDATDPGGEGQIYATGEYTGLLSRDITLTVTGVDNSTGRATGLAYSYLDDLGRTITGEVEIDGYGTANAVDLGDGISVYLANTDFVAGEVYTLTIGRQNGNDEDIYVSLSEDNRMDINFTVFELFGMEGYSSSLVQDGDGNLVEEGWSNALDLIAQWAQALALDDTEQDYFTAIADSDNSLKTTADFLVSGDHTELTGLDLSFYVGYPVQALSADMDLSNYSDFTVTAVNADGSIDVDYTYDDGSGPVVYSTTFPGTGNGNAIYLEPPEDGVQVYLVDATYYVGDTFSMAGNNYQEGTVPNSTNPVTITYTFTDENNKVQYHTITVDGTGEVNSVDLGGMERYQTLTSTTAAESATSAVGVDGSFTLWVYEDDSRWSVTVNNILSTDTMQDIADKINTALDAARALDPTFPTDYPLASITEGLKLNLQGSETLSFAFTDEVGDVLTELGIVNPYSLTISEGGTLASYDQFDLTLEQYGQGQDASQRMLDSLEGLMSNLLNYSSDAGSRLNRLDVRETLLDDEYLRLNDRLETYLDTDVADAILNLQTYQVMYQATLQATAMVSSSTLADYI